MKTTTYQYLLGLVAMTLGTIWLIGCASGPKADGAAPNRAKMEPAALTLLKSASVKLGAARTIQVEAEHKLDPRLGLGLAIDNGRIELAIKRPNQFYAIRPADAETREIAYDGHQLCVMYPGAGHHALEDLEARNIEDFALQMEERFGFRPPLGDLLASDMAAELLIDVTSARLLKRERVGGTDCDHLQLEQEGMTTDLWLGVDDQLPRRLLTTITDMPGDPQWDIRLSQWKLDAPLDEGLFSKRPAADSQKVPMLRSQ